MRPSGGRAPTCYTHHMNSSRQHRLGGRWVALRSTNSTLSTLRRVRAPSSDRACGHSPGGLLVRNVCMFHTVLLSAFMCMCTSCEAGCHPPAVGTPGTRCPGSAPQGTTGSPVGAPCGPPRPRSNSCRHRRCRHCRHCRSSLPPATGQARHPLRPGSLNRSAGQGPGWRALGRGVRVHGSRQRVEIGVAA